MREVIYSISDVEVGDGSITDDFVNDELLAQSIADIDKKHGSIPAYLVVNGDGFDFIKMAYKGKYPRYITKEISLWKLDQMVRVHKKVFDAYKKFASKKKNTLVFVLGNHDMDIAFPEVQERLRKVIHESIVFCGFNYDHGPVHIEHGSQHDSVFFINPDHIFIPFGKGAHSRLILNLPWVTYSFFEYYYQFKIRYPFVERIFPRTLVMERYPSLAKEITWGGMKYFIKSAIFNQVRFYNDMTYRLSPRILLNFLYRVITSKYELLFEDNLQELFEHHKAVKVIIAGHSHVAKHVQWGPGQSYLNTGTWRDEYVMEPSTNKLLRKDKYIAEVVINGSKVESVLLNEIPVPK